MRVYEFAKKMDVSSKELVSRLRSQGFDIKSHMSVLTDEAIQFLQKKPTQGLSNKQPSKAVPKKTVSASSNTMQKDFKEKKEQEKERIAFKRTKPSRRDDVSGSRKPKKEVAPVMVPPTEILVEPMTVADLAEKLVQPVNEIILRLLRVGIIATRNQLLNNDVVRKVAEFFSVTPIEHVSTMETEKAVTVQEGHLQKRLPVVVVLGHVDHGKTSLLDYIRNTRLVHKEHGGITQHIGAYEAKTPQGNVVFLDTPGHEAFPKIRQRGVRVADIAVLVIAADDGIKPQTVEAIKIIKNMNVPTIVAVNKMDKVDPSRVDVIKQQLSQYDMLPEEWGGDVMVIPISAKDGTGIDELLSMLALQADIMELRANFDVEGKGYILESRLEKGRGPVATVMLQTGAMHVGEYFSCGNVLGKISSLTDSYGVSLKKVGPSVPVVVAGFDSLPTVGDYLEIISKEAFLQKRRDIGDGHKKSLLTQSMNEGCINLIIKVDTDSTKEALIGAIEKIDKKQDVGFNIIAAAIGSVNEGDVELAYNTGSRIIGFQVKADVNALNLARRRNVSIDLHTIIYRLLEHLESLSQKEAPKEIVRVKTGQAIVRKVFNIKNIGVIAGCYVQDGTIVKNGYAIGWRGDEKVGEGKIMSLQRDKKAIKDVAAGYECGFIVQGVTEWQVDDRIECFIDQTS